MERIKAYTLKELNFNYLIKLSIQEYGLEKFEDYTYSKYRNNNEFHPSIKGFCTICEEENCNRDNKNQNMKLGCISHGTQASDFIEKYSKIEDVIDWYDTPVMFLFENPSNNYDFCKEYKYNGFTKLPPAHWWRLDCSIDETVDIKIISNMKKYEQTIWELCKEFRLKNFYTTNLIKCGMGNIKNGNWGNWDSYSSECKNNCFKYVFCEELRLFNPKIIFACRKSVFDFLMNKKNNNCECLQNIDIVLLPHPAAQINGSFRFTLNYMRVAATLYNNKIIDEETYLNKCIKYAEISHVL